jgi:hypothetical protein
LLDIRYYVPPIYTLRLRDTVDVREHNVLIKPQYSIRRDEGTPVTEDFRIYAKRTRLFEVEPVDVEDQYTFIYTVYSLLTVNAIYTDRAALVPDYVITADVGVVNIYTDRLGTTPEYVITADVSITNIYTDRVIIVPEYISKVEVSVTQMSTDRATI